MTFGPAPSGTVYRLGSKHRVPGEHGLPKPEVESARIVLTGLEGDYNVYRQEERKGDPEMALLFLPVETVRELNAEGWPVRPGDLGENVTTEGIETGRWRPGVHLRLGSVEATVSKICTPCANLHLLPYVGESKGPEFVRTMVDRRGWYASVARAGTVRKGDPIFLSE